MDVSRDYHPLAGIAFPTSVDRFVRTQVQQHDDWGHDISAGYGWPMGNSDTKLTFNVYPAEGQTDANRLRYLKDPDTGRRVSRLNPAEHRVVTEVPDLRIVSNALWQQVKARQQQMSGLVVGASGKGLCNAN